MKKQIILYLLLSIICVLLTPVIAQDEWDVFEKIEKLYQAKDCKGTKIECESFLRNFGSSAQVERMLRESEDCLKLRDSIKHKTISVTQKKRFIVNPMKVEFPYTGGQIPISITAEASWDIYEAPGWVDFKIENNVLILLCGVNYHNSAREDEIVFRDEYNNEARINVFQDKNPDYLRLSTNRIYEEDARGSTYFITVSSNKSWHVNSYPHWCKVETKQNEIKVTLERNHSGYERKGEIEVVVLSNGANLRSVLFVGQAKLEHYLLLSNPGFDDNTGRGSKSVPIIVETDLGYYRIENIPAWCAIEDQTETSFSVRILKNCGGGARSAQLKVVAGNQSRPFTISQVARSFYVDVDPSESIKARKQGGHMIYKVETNCGTWRVVNLPDWCQLEDETSDSFKINILPNEGESRTANFSVSASGYKCNLTIIQE